MSLSLEIRRAVPDDWRAIGALLDDNALPRDGAPAHLDHFIVATQQGIIVGCAGLELGGPSALLRSVAVAPLLQRQGIGTRLFDAIIELACQYGVRHIWLLTTTAADYFSVKGFVPVPRNDEPPELAASAEFLGACPASATLLRRDLPIA